MVTFKNLSAYAGDPPKDGGSRKITGGPLYTLAEIQALAATPDAVKLWTEKCRRDVSHGVFLEIRVE